MKANFISVAIGIAIISMMSCNSTENKNDNEGQPTNDGSVVATYVANLSPLNTNVTKMNTTAQAKFILTKDSLLVTIDATGVPPGIQHWQHFHGFKNNDAATCATAASDANGDGIVDVVETESASGTTMVPFNEKSEEMDLGSDTYPEAGSDSTYHYEARISLAKLRASFQKSFGDSTLDLDRRVLYIHGVPENYKLPTSVASIGDIPAHVTIPIACGKIEKVNE